MSLFAPLRRGAWSAPRTKPVIWGITAAWPCAVAVAVLAAPDYAVEVGLGLMLVVALVLFAHHSWVSRRQRPAQVVRGLITGLTVRYDPFNNLVIDVEVTDAKTGLETQEEVKVGRGLFTAAGGAIRIWETPHSWWRRQFLILASSPATDVPVLGPHSLTPSRGTQRFRLTGGRTVSVRLDRGVVYRQDRSASGTVRLFAGRTTNPRASLAGAWLRAAAPDDQKPSWWSGWSWPGWSAILTMDWYRTVHHKGTTPLSYDGLQAFAAGAGMIIAIIAPELSTRTFGTMVMTLALGWLSGWEVARSRQRLRDRGAQFVEGARTELVWAIVVTAAAGIGGMMATLQLRNAQTAAGIAFGVLTLVVAAAAGQAAIRRGQEAWRTMAARSGHGA